MRVLKALHPFYLFSILVITLANIYAEDKASPIDFKKQIYPILASCFDCHGEDKQKSRLRVDRRASLLRGGDYSQPSIVPGKPEESYLLSVISGKDPEMRMPPKGDLLKAEDVALLTRWIREGANWPGQMTDKPQEEVTSDHWSLQEVKRPIVPSITQITAPRQGDSENQVNLKRWSRNPIDAFILRKLSKYKVKPSPQADRATLLRRVTLDLTGLPPTPKEQEDFLKDPSETSEAYRNVVKRLLKSPRYGERWAQHWLDVIRYADTRGYEYNSVRPNAWPYRDYVIDAFNNDKPWDRFIVEQLAGDSLGVDPATGFLVTAPLPTPQEVGEEPAQIKLTRYNSLDEIVQNISVSMLGLTVGCARCHNHKFDPVTMKDYYGLIACLEGVQYKERPWRKNGNDHRFAEIRKTEERIAQIKKTLAHFPTWRESSVDKTSEHFPSVPARYIRFTVFETDEKRNGVAFDEIEVYSRPEIGHRQNVALARKGAKATSSGAWSKSGREKALNDGRFGGKSTWISAKRPTPDNWVQIELPGIVSIDSVTWSRDRHLAKKYPKEHAVRLAREYQIEVAVEPGQWKLVVSRTRSEGLAMNEVRQRRLLEQELSQLQTQRPARSKLPQVFAGAFKQPGPTYLFHRGDPQQAKNKVPPSGLSVIGGLELGEESPEHERRLALAQWIASSKNPLTARVAVNRFWHHHFGRGIVTTPGDFGTQGASPSHPELLDWLAAEFVNKNWSVKYLHELIVTSATYCQSNRPLDFSEQKKAGISVDDSLLWRFPPRRLEAEAIRDSLLFVSGKLDFTAGGPGFSVYGTKSAFGEWKPKTKLGPKTWRRMIYMQKMRAADDGMFKVFDLPDCGQVMTLRGESTTPLQALNMFNSEFLYEHAAYLGARVAAECGADATPEKLAERLFLIALSRRPSDSERRLVAAVIREDSLTSASRAVLNTNEFLILP